MTRKGIIFIKIDKALFYGKNGNKNLQKLTKQMAGGKWLNNLLKKATIMRI